MFKKAQKQLITIQRQNRISQICYNTSSKCTVSKRNFDPYIQSVRWSRNIAFTRQICQFMHHSPLLTAPAPVGGAGQSNTSWKTTQLKDFRLKPVKNQRSTSSFTALLARLIKVEFHESHWMQQYKTVSLGDTMTEEVRLFIIVLCKGNFFRSSRQLSRLKKKIYLDWLFDINKRLYSSLSMST